MSENITGMKRTCLCGTLRESDIGKTVTVMGWVHKYRNLGGMLFIDLRDRSGLLQILLSPEKDKELFDKASKIRTEFVIAVKGEVVKRDDINEDLPTGKIEILCSELRILSEAKTTPFYIEEDTDTNEALRLKYRYLDLRRPDMQNAIMTRHKITQSVRNFYNDNGFLDIETPMLTKSTPEGARDYLVPSRINPGSFYALPQSPQIFKQLLMVSGYDRYYQIVKCFRDEDLRADRQPEFTQIDVEMSFVNVDDVLDINEKMIQKLFKDILDVDIKLPFPRLTYKEAMERYGSDKPDTRFKMELKDISDIAEKCDFRVFSGTVKKGGSVRLINAKGCGDKFSRREIDGLEEYVKTYKAKGLAWIAVKEDGIKSSIAKFFTQDEIDEILKRADAKPGDLICFIADKDSVVFDALGHLRLEIAKKIDLLKDNTDYNLLWVTEFPLLEYSEEENRYVAMHHPFTSPMEQDLALLDKEPLKVRANAYDMVLNGVEIGGGSIRIHNSDMQDKIFSLLGFSKEEAKKRFGFLLEAFKYGTPPHGGIAYGLDRLVMLMTGKTSIREVIAFPKVQNASSPMTGAPNPVDKQQLEELKIKTD